MTELNDPGMKAFLEETEQRGLQIKNEQLKPFGNKLNPKSNGYYRVLRRLHRSCRNQTMPSAQGEEGNNSSSVDELFSATASFLHEKDVCSQDAIKPLQLPEYVGMELTHSEDELFMTKPWFERVSNVNYVVLHFQAKFNASAAEQDDDAMTLEEDKAEEIRRYCEAVSLPARLFARHLALAQVTNEDDASTPTPNTRCPPADIRTTSMPGPSGMTVTNTVRPSISLASN